MVHSMHNNSHIKTEKTVYLPHPLAIPFCQVIIDCNYVNSLPRQGIQVSRHCSSQGFTFTRFHFRYPPLVEDDTTQHLDIIMPHAENPFGCFPYHSKSLRQEIIQGFAFFKPRLKLHCFGLKLRIR